MPESERAKSEVVRDHVLGMVQSLPPGERIPSERALCSKLKIARETLRRGVEDLVSEGFLERRPGSGTFVSRPKITKQFRIASFTEDMRARGFVPSSRVVLSETRHAGGHLCRHLRISPSQDVLVVQRLRLADGTPMAIETLHTPCDLVPGLDGIELENQSFYRAIEARYGLSIAATHQTIEATVTDEAESALLEVPPLSPALFIERTSLAQTGRPVEYVKSVFRGDRYKFEVESTRRSRLLSDKTHHGVEAQV